VSEARKVIQDKEAERLLSSDLVVKEALRAAAEDGIVFIDEIDKIVDSQRGSVSTSANVSNEGVQRDLLPILEGCQVRAAPGSAHVSAMPQYKLLGQCWQQ
jgi:ATP-dependent HslUV protease ATP-binding subunit HslU